jgi:hypothetical protein
MAAFVESEGAPFAESEPAPPPEAPPEPAPAVAPPVAFEVREPPPQAAPEPESTHPALAAHAPVLEPPPEPEAPAVDEREAVFEAPPAPFAPSPKAAPPPIELVETPWLPEAKEARPERPRERLDPKPPPPEPEPTMPAVASCEAAVAANQEQMDLTRRGTSTPDVTREAYAALLENGSYLAPCNVPDHVALDLCVAVQNGRAVGITVGTTPRNARVRACVTRAVQRIAFPQSPRLDVTRTRFAPAE